MKWTFLTIVLFSISISSLCQTSALIKSKPPLDTSVLDKWPSVEAPVMSNDGNFAMFTIKNIPAGGNASFTEDSKKAIFLNANDSMGIINLNDYQVKFIPAISSFKISGGNEQWLAFQIKGNKGLAIENLNSGDQKTFDSVIGYYFSPGGKVLLVQKEHKKNVDETLQEVIWVNLFSENKQIIWQGFQSKNFVFSESDSELAFIGTEPISILKKEEENKSIFYFKLGLTKAIILFGNQSTGFNSNLVVDKIGYEGFSDNGNLLFLL